MLRKHTHVLRCKSRARQYRTWPPRPASPPSHPTRLSILRTTWGWSSIERRKSIGSGAARSLGLGRLLLLRQRQCGSPGHFRSAPGVPIRIHIWAESAPSNWLCPIADEAYRRGNTNGGATDARGQLSGHLGLGYDIASRCRRLRRRLLRDRGRQMQAFVQQQLHGRTVVHRHGDVPVTCGGMLDELDDNAE